MRKLITGWLRRWAESQTAKDVTRLQARVTELESRLKLAELEMATLAAINARDLKRVQAETATAARRIADAEGRANVSSF